MGKRNMINAPRKLYAYIYIQVAAILGSVLVVTNDVRANLNAANMV